MNEPRMKKRCNVGCGAELVVSSNQRISKYRMRYRNYRCEKLEGHKGKCQFTAMVRWFV
jgi:hypothetical protein